MAEGRVVRACRMNASLRAEQGTGSRAERLRRLARVARAALAHFDWAKIVPGCERTFRGESGAEFGIQLVADWENTTYRIRQPAADRDFLLRLHRPGLRTEPMVAAEFSWLDALRREGLPVQQPQRTRLGEACARLETNERESPRLCSLLSWVPGRFQRRAGAKIMARVGATLAELHANGWQAPEGFERPRLDFDWLVGARGGLGFGPRVLDALPAAYHRTREQALLLLEPLFEQCVEDEMRLIHGDLHLNNLLFLSARAVPIDFDDCGFGYPQYDFATLLHLFREREDWPAWREQLFTAYRLRRRLPSGLEHALDGWILCRRLNMLLWMAGRAPEHAGIGAQLAGMLASNQRMIRLIQQNKREHGL